MPPIPQASWLLFLTLIACNRGPESICDDGLDNDADGFVDCDDPDCGADDACGEGAKDADGDGYDAEAAGGDDCDDQDAAVHPGADELCNDVDDDCDGEVDDDPVDMLTWFLDADSDGYGVSSLVERACDQPIGYAADSGDCDDDDASIYPGADEVWYDGVDSDCDEASDYDQDTDGYDAQAYGGEDCDDEDATIHPAAGETWYDGVDSDCAGDDDYDQDADGYASDEYEGEDCDDTAVEVHPGAIDQCFDGVDSDCDGMLDCSLAEAHAKLIGLEGESSGTSLAPAGDVNGDGFDDLLIGAPNSSWSSGGSSSGRVYVAYGPHTGEVDLSSSSTVAGYLNGTYESGQAGQSVAGAGDVNGDGYDDFVVGAYLASTGGTQSGTAYLVYGPAGSGSPLSTAELVIEGETGSENVGRAVAGGGDLTGDGVPDVVIGAPGYQDDTGYRAAVVVSGAETGVMALSDSGFFLVGEHSSDEIGRCEMDIADLNGDGFDDLLLGAYQSPRVATHAGAVFLVYGPITSDIDLADADAILEGEEEMDHAGNSLDLGADVDGDGLSDAVIGAYYDSDAADYAGAAYLVTGGEWTTGSLSEADAKLLGPYSSARAGYSVADLGDLDSDGHAELGVGVLSGNSDGFDGGWGMVVVVSGPVSGTNNLVDVGEVILGSEESGSQGFQVSAAGDMDADGVPDFATAAYQDDSGGTNAGATYLFFMGQLD